MKRNSPLWVDKIDSGPYMRRDRFQFAKRVSNQPLQDQQSLQASSPSQHQYAAEKQHQQFHHLPYQSSTSNTIINADLENSIKQNNSSAKKKQINNDPNKNGNSRYMKQGSITDRSMNSKEIINSILTDSGQHQTHVNNILFPGAKFSAHDHNKNYEDVIIIEHIRQLDREAAVQQSAVLMAQQKQQLEQQLQSTFKPLPLAALSLTKRTTNNGGTKRSKKRSNINVQHDLDCSQQTEESPQMARHIDMTLPKQNEKVLIVQDGAKNAIHRKMTLLLEKHQNQSISITNVPEETNSSVVETGSMQSITPKQVELNLVSFEQFQTNDLNAHFRRNKHTTKHQQQPFKNSNKTAEKNVQNPSQIVVTNQFTAQQQEMPPSVQHQPMAIVQQRMMTSDGRVSSHNLYGNLKGTHNRIATSIGNSSSSVSPSIQHKLNCSKHSVADAQSKSNLLLSSELKSEIGRNSVVMKDVVKPQLPRMSTIKEKKKPRHILVQEVNAHLYKDIADTDGQNLGSPRGKYDESQLTPKHGRNKDKTIDHHQNGQQQTEMKRGQIDTSQLDLQRKVENRSYSPQSRRGQNKIISAINDRSRQIQVSLLQNQQSPGAMRAESVRQSGISSSAAEQESILRMSKDQEALQQLVTSRMLPTISQIKAASFEGQYKPPQKETTAYQKQREQRGLTIDPVPSHIVPPRKKQPALPIERQIVDRRPPSSLSNANSQKSQKQQKRKMRRYADVKQEMLAMNNDPSRDVLQTLLNPYEGFDDTERQPHPFQIKRNSKQDERKNSKVIHEQAGEEQLMDASLKEVLQQQLSQINSARALRPLQEHQLIKRGGGVANQSLSPETMQMTLDQRSGQLSIGSHGQSSTARDQLAAGYLNAAHAAAQVHAAQSNFQQLQLVAHQRQVSHPATERRQQQVLLPDIVVNRSVQDQGTSHHFSLQHQQQAKNVMYPHHATLSPRQITVENLSPVQMRVVLQNQGGTGGSDSFEQQNQFIGMASQRNLHSISLPRELQHYHHQSAYYTVDPGVHYRQNHNQQSHYLNKNNVKVVYKSPYGQQQQTGALATKRGSRDTNNDSQTNNPQGQNSNPTSRLQNKFERTMDQFSPWD